MEDTGVEGGGVAEAAAVAAKAEEEEAGGAYPVSQIEPSRVLATVDRPCCSLMPLP